MQVPGPAGAVQAGEGPYSRDLYVTYFESGQMSEFERSL